MLVKSMESKQIYREFKKNINSILCKHICKPRSFFYFYEKDKNNSLRVRKVELICCDKKIKYSPKKPQSNNTS